MAAGMVESTIEMNLVCCNAAVSACDKGRQLVFGQSAFQDANGLKMKSITLVRVAGFKEYVLNSVPWPEQV
jgi:hypothetical protein